MTVWLIGAGPGDAELLTVKAAAVLGRADAVVHDRLIGPDVLDLTPPSAERYDVGKIPGRAGPDQAEINRLLISLAARFETVVRVKGGDPYLFGRGIEEARDCLAAGVEVEVVPGISSALAGPMAAGISVTERAVSSGVCVVSAEQGPRSEPLRWKALVETGLTLVVLMGARSAARIRDTLLDNGLGPDTPTAIAGSVSRPDEHRWIGPLRDLGRTPVQAPAVIVVGPAAAAGIPAGGGQRSTERRAEAGVSGG